MMEGKKPRLGNTTTDDLVVDRISELPDSILGQILSFLPTDFAVATSLLSKRWKFAWVTLHSLEFSYRNKANEAECMEFVRFVNRVLLLNDAGWLNKFRLHGNCGPVSMPSRINSWFNTAITKNVKELYLSVKDYCFSRVMVLPTSLFTCESLRCLDLEGFSFIYFATAVCLPRLERLKIDRVSFESEESCEKLISGCPMLHYLNMDFYHLDLHVASDFMVIISSPSLRCLQLYFSYRSRLKVMASSLEYISLGGHLSEIFVEKSLRSLVHADLSLEIRLGAHDLRNNSFVEAVRAFHCAKVLILTTDVMWALGHATINVSTEFKRLTELTVFTHCVSVQDFIQNSENLEDLTISQYSTNDNENPRWIAPIEVPKCLSKRLKKVSLDGYRGLEDEREMIRYMLEHGSALEVMHIYCCSEEDGEMLKLLLEICEFPRKSPVCKVRFSK